jgi:hypothetical protein
MGSPDFRYTVLPPCFPGGRVDAADEDSSRAAGGSRDPGPVVLGRQAQGLRRPREADWAQDLPRPVPECERPDTEVHPRSTWCAYRYTGEKGGP